MAVYSSGREIYCRHCGKEIKPSRLVAHTWVHRVTGTKYCDASRTVKAER